MIFTHSYDHPLNQDFKDVCFKVIVLKEIFHISRKVIKLVKDSPQRHTRLKVLKSQITKNVYMNFAPLDRLCEGKH